MYTTSQFFQGDKKALGSYLKTYALINLKYIHKGGSADIDKYVQRR